MVLRLLCLLLLISPASLAAERVTVFAAASLKDVLEAAADSFDGEVRFSFAGSSTLARQIAAGAPADVFLSANVAWLDWLEDQGLVVAKTRRDVIGNQLALVTHAQGMLDQNIKTLSEAIEEKRISMALVGAVPAGIYGRQALEHQGLWEMAAPNVVQTDNVRAALALVALGELPLGIVYRSDAVAEHRVRVLDVDLSGHDPIVYPGAVIKPGDAGSAAFLNHLAEDYVQTLFEAHGFLRLTP